MPIDHSLPYDDTNVFARILRGELPAKRVFENDHALVIHDLQPLSPIHLLAMPKGAYVSMDDFTARGSAEEVAALFAAVAEAARQTGANAQGYRIVSNVGKRGGQEIAHLHVHVLGGEPLGPILKR